MGGTLPSISQTETNGAQPEPDAASLLSPPRGVDVGDVHGAGMEGEGGQAASS